MRKKLLVVGTMAYDAIETPHHRVDRILGGAATYIALASSKFDLDCGLVSVIGTDFLASDLEKLTSVGVDISGVEQVKNGKTFFWSGRYHDDMNTRTTIDTQLNVLENFNPVVPTPYLKSNVVVIGNLHPQVQLSAINQLVLEETFTILDSMNFWMEHFRDTLDEVIAKVNLISINDEEARILSGEFSLTKAAKVILEMGPEFVIIKKGEHGSMLFSKKDMFVSSAFPIEQVVDPTGAGDSFAGGLAGYLAQSEKIDFEAIKQAILIGSVFASYTVEDFGVSAIDSASKTDLQNRLNIYKKLTHVNWELNRFQI